MKDEYDFSKMKSRKNPYASKLKKPVTMRLGEDVISYFKDMSELNQKESPRLYLGSKILNMMGVKTELTKDSIKIYGQPDLKIKKLITIKDYLKDHRIFMMSTIAALTFGGEWKIHDKDSVNTSFPDFLKIIKKISNKPL